MSEKIEQHKRQGIYSGIHISETDERIQGMMKKWGFEYFLCRNGGWVTGIPILKSTESIPDKDYDWGFKDEYGRDVSDYFHEDVGSYSIHIQTYSTGVTREDMEYFWDWKN